MITEPLAPWRSPLARALHLNRSLVYARYVQLATVRPDGRPANRTVVFRGFLEASNQLKFITDHRSSKIEQIDHQPWAEVCWYFPKSREQFRLLGPLQILDANGSVEDQRLRDRQWQELSDGARLQFVWPHPGLPRQSGDAFEVSSPDPQQPPSTFCLVLLQPIEVDHLQLRGNPQDRDRYCYQDGQWTTTAVNP